MSKIKVSGKKLIIQLGRDETLLALWDKGPQFLHTAAVPTPEGAVEDGEIRNPDAVCSMLQTALSVPEFQDVYNVVFSLCTSRVITETVTTPDMPNKKLSKLIQANIDMYFPVDMTDYRLVWQTIGPKISNNGMKELSVQLWAVPHAILQPYYVVANACGLSVAAIDYCGNSIASAVGASFSMSGSEKKRPTINLNTEISFNRKKEALPEDLSSVPTPVDSNAVTDLHLTLEKDLIGVTFVQNNRVVHQRFIQTGINPVYQFDEVAMMVEYFASLDMGRGTEFKAAVSGNLSNDENLVAELSAILDMPLSVYETAYTPCWVICAGAAQTKLDYGNPDLNRPTKAVTSPSTKLCQTAVLTAGAAALAGVVMLSFVAKLSWNATIESMEAHRQELTIQAKRVAGFADKYKTYDTLYTNYENDWNTVFNSLRTYNDNLVRVLEELESVLPEKTSVTALSIGSDGLDVQFACENKEEAAYLIMQLRELQYADLYAISSLSGGGRGAANSYGNGEQAPTEGGVNLSEADRSELEKLFTKDFGPYNITANLSQAQILAMEANYGELPETDIVLDDGSGSGTTVTHKCKTIAQLEQVYTSVLNPGASITQAMRIAAIKQVLDTNPFSSYWFVKELYADYNNGMDFSKVYFWDLVDLKDKNLIVYDTPADVESSMGHLIRICTVGDDYFTAEERVAEAERLIMLNETLEQWYVYYLQEEINKAADAADDSDTAVYLDMEAVLEDVLDNGAFNSANSELNAKLNQLMSAETKAAVAKHTSTTTTPAPTPTPSLKPIVTPTPTPSLKPDTVLPGGITISQVEEQLLKYAHTGKTDYYPLLDTQLDKYVSTGTTDYPEIDAALDAYIASGKGDELAKVMVKDYLETGKFGSDALNAAIDDYSKKGTTGNTVIDARLEAFMESDEAEQIFTTLLNEYITNGKTDYPHLDSMIENYITTGSTGKAGFDKLIEKAIDDFAREQWPTQTIVYDLLTKIKNKGKSGDSVFDLLYTRYLIMKKTGSEYLDKLIFNFSMNQGSKDDIQNALGNGGGGGGTGPVDTRIAFTVSLGYSADLMMEELERKGLSNDSKVERLEVGN